MSSLNGTKTTLWWHQLFISKSRNIVTKIRRKILLKCSYGLEGSKVGAKGEPTREKGLVAINFCIELWKTGEKKEEPRKVRNPRDQKSFISNANNNALNFLKGFEECPQATLPVPKKISLRSGKNISNHLKPSPRFPSQKKERKKEPFVLFFVEFFKTNHELLLKCVKNNTFLNKS